MAVKSSLLFVEDEDQLTVQRLGSVQAPGPGDDEDGDDDEDDDDEDDYDNDDDDEDDEDAIMRALENGDGDRFGY